MYFIPSKIFLAGRRKRRIFPRHLEEWVPPFHVENEKKRGWRWMAMIRSNETVRLRVLTIGEKSWIVSVIEFWSNLIPVSSR